MIHEEPLVFPCRGDSLVGVLSLPGTPGGGRVGVLVIVGGEQYRVGSHRQFVHLARALASGGVPTMRFDCRGMGDATGEHPGFEEMADDIRSALDVFLEKVEGLRGVVLWGLCDGASAACLYSATDRRVLGCVLANPWVRTEKGEATTLLRRYYLPRLFRPAWWVHALRGRWRAAGSLKGVGRALARSLKRGSSPGHGDDLPDRMADALERGGVPFAVILSGDDLVAAEFEAVVERTDAWARLIKTRLVAKKSLPGADHTFARADWREEVARFTLEGVQAIASANAGP